MRAFKVGDKVTSEEYGDGEVRSNEFCPSGYPVCVEFSDGSTHDFTQEGLYWEKGCFSPYKNIKHKEAQGMNKSDLKTGMVVMQANGWLGIVLADAGFILGGGECVPLDRVNDDLTSEDSKHWNIVEVYSVPNRKSDYLNTSLEHRTLLWQREEVKEMTVDEISKALGYTVKVVGGE